MTADPTRRYIAFFYSLLFLLSFQLMAWIRFINKFTRVDKKSWISKVDNIEVVCTRQNRFYADRPGAVLVLLFLIFPSSIYSSECKKSSKKSFSRPAMVLHVS